MTAVASRCALLITLVSPMAMADSDQSSANGFIEDST